jgi:hypothetical protein
MFAYSPGGTPTARERSSASPGRGRHRAIAGRHIPHLAALAKRYADRKPDLADLSLIRMSERHPRHSLITTDREGFRDYRRDKREAIPLICPPGPR